jgi:hypothetical protein
VYYSGRKLKGKEPCETRGMFKRGTNEQEEVGNWEKSTDDEDVLGPMDFCCACTLHTVTGIANLEGGGGGFCKSAQPVDLLPYDI